jgi:hypothetical protein
VKHLLFLTTASSKFWLAVFLSLAAFLAEGAPGNDLFINRTTLVGRNASVSGSNSGAGSEPGEDTGGGAIYRHYSVWYAWTAPTNGVLHISGTTAVWNFYMSIRAYRGSAVNALTLAATTPDGGVPVVAGDTVAIQVASIYYSVWSGGGGTGPFTLSLSLEVPEPASPNDSFANRFELSAPAYHLDGSIYGATSEPGEPLPPATSQTLWWKFSAPESGVLGIFPSTPQFTPAITLYQGNALEILTPVAALNSYRYQVQAGHEYALQMASGAVPGGAFSLDTEFFPSTNDFFAGSTRLEGTNINYIGNMTTATLEPGEPNPGYSNTIWVSWAAPATGRARFSQTVVGWSQPVNVYTGATLEHLQPVRVVGLVNGRNDFLAVEGTVYHFQISGQADECNLSIQFLPWTPASNDFFAFAHPMTGQYVNEWPNEEWFPIGEATSELGEPALLDGAAFKSLWWKWVAPTHGNATFRADSSLATNVVLACYQGDRIGALTLRGKGANAMSFTTTGGNTYYIAAAVPTNASGDVFLNGGITFQSSASHAVPGNLLREPSWEGTAILEAQYWGSSGGVGGSVNESDGCDGSTWPYLGGGSQIWQDIATIPGQNYLIRFAMRAKSEFVGGGSGDGRVRGLWDGQEIGVAVLPGSELNFWHWGEFTAHTTNSTSRVAFVNLARNIEMDAFSVVALDEAPVIVTQPSPTAAIEGGTAGFIVGASGSSPLTYQWYFNDEPYVTLTSPVLLMDPVSTNLAGTYYAVVSNPFGSATSAPVVLTVEAPTKPLILWQPYGDIVGQGGSYHFSVIAAGTPPLHYQWLKDDFEISGATNPALTFSSVDFTNAGMYSVRIQNSAGTVWSLNAKLTVTNAIDGGGKIFFVNRFFGNTNVEAPVFDLDGITPLNGSNYLAQLYGGPSLELLRPVGQPSHFQAGFGAGFFFPQLVTLPTVPPGSNAVVQVRAWDGNKGSTYEESRAFGGKFGKSELLTVTVGGGLMPPADLTGLRSFSLQAGLPQLITGKITFVGREPGGIVVWSHTGEPGFRYLIEKSIHGFDWHPYLVITNVTSSATFTDSANSGSSATFYRSRILD